MISSFAMKSPKLLLSLFLWHCILDLSQTQTDQFAGPYRMLLRQMERCEEKENYKIYPSSTRISKVSRNKFIYSTNVTSEIYMGDNLSIDLDFAAFGNGGWRPHFLQMDFPNACSSTKKMLPMLFKIIETTIHECPIPPGTYKLNLDTDYIKVGNSMPSFPYGKYRMDLNAKENDTLVSCFRIYIDVVPAKRQRPQKKKKNNS